VNITNLLIKKIMVIPNYILLFFLMCNAVIAQQSFTVKGIFPQALQKEVLLKGFTILGDSLLSKTISNAKGEFKLSYPASYFGAAILEVKDTKSVIVLLNRENFEMQWDNLEDFSTLKFVHSPENVAFGSGMELYQTTEAKRAGLTFLRSYYNNEPLKLKKIQKEIRIQDKAMHNFLAGLPKDSYACYYLKIRKLIADMPQTASRYIERMPENENEFNALDFSDKRLWQSGLFQELLSTYIVMLESYGDKQYPHMHAATDAVISSFSDTSVMRGDVAEYLFKLYEKRSLFPAAEHLALSMLSSSSCQSDGKRVVLFEQYRKMAKGNIAPDLVLENTKFEKVEFSKINNKYKLVVFGSSGCAKCIEEIPRIKDFYSDWKKRYDLEMIFVSLDSEKEKYEGFIKDFPWISSCDFKGWEGINVKEYCVFATPTMYLLDSERKIVLKPKSAEHLNAWLQSNAVN